MSHPPLERGLFDPGRPSRPASFAIWSLPGAPDDATVLRDVLAHGRGGDVRGCRFPDEWMASEADVLVLRATTDTAMPSRDRFLATHDFSALTRRRVLGIGGEAGRAFGALGLAIAGRNTATFPRRRPTMVLEKCGVLPAQWCATTVLALESEETIDSEALHIPPTSDLAPHVDVIARCASHPNYAVLARQLNHVFCGVGADAKRWTTEFRALIREVAFALAARPVEPFVLPTWDVAAPGLDEFDLSPGGSTTGAYERSYRFEFELPVVFSAALDILASDATMLFLGAGRGHRDMRRLDGRTGDTLRTVVPITPDSIRANAGSYWQLRVVNFDPRAIGRYRLRIEYSRATEVRVADGVCVSMLHPQADAATISALIELLRAGDDETAARAEAGLVAVGRAALPALRAVREPRCLAAAVAIEMGER